MLEAMKHISSAVTAGVVLIGLFAYIARPHAEQFIQETVQGRIGQIEKGQEDNNVKLRHVERQLKENADVAREIQMEQRVIGEQQKLILDILKQRLPEGN